MIEGRMGTWWEKLWRFTFYSKLTITLVVRGGGVGNPADGGDASLGSNIKTKELQERHHCKR